MTRRYDSNVVRQAVDQILDQALQGIGPLPSASDLAGEYKRGPYGNDTERVRALIRSACTKNTVTGFLAGLGGMLMFPVAIPSSLAASLAIQASMVAAIAELHGHRSEDDHVRVLILACMLGIGIEEVAKKAGIVVGEKIAIELLKELPGKVLIEINKKVGFRLLTKFGEKGVVNLVKLVPVVGGVVGGALDGANCWAVGRIADRVFRPTGPRDT